MCRAACALLASLAMLAACRTPDPPAISPPPPATEWTEGEYLLRLRAGTDPAELGSVLDVVRGELLRSYELVGRLHHFRSALAPEQVLRLLAADPRVESVSPNRTLRSSADLPDDPHFFRQWGLANHGQVFHPDAGLKGTPRSDIGVLWSFPWRHAKQGLPVAVLDSGVHLAHEDLRDNLWRNAAEAQGAPGVDDDGNGFVDDVHGWDFVPTKAQLAAVPLPAVLGGPDVSDVQGHGTAVASILGAVAGNKVGMAGVSPLGRILVLKVMRWEKAELLTDLATVIAALEYAVKQGVRVSSNSYGAQVADAGAPDFLPLDLAIQAAGFAGHLFVTSAGNEGQDIDAHPFLPASFPHQNIVAVTGVDWDDQLPASLSFGPVSVDLAAPGSAILVASSLGPQQYAYSTTATSFAVPHVAGAVALRWSLLPLWSPAWMRYGLIASVRPVPALQGKVKSGGVLRLPYDHKKFPAPLTWWGLLGFSVPPQ